MDQLTIDTIRQSLASGDADATLALLSSVTSDADFTDIELITSKLRCYIIKKDKVNAKIEADKLIALPSDDFTIPNHRPPYVDAVIEYIKLELGINNFVDKDKINFYITDMNPYRQFIYNYGQYDTRSNADQQFHTLEALWLLFSETKGKVTDPNIPIHTHEVSGTDPVSGCGPDCNFASYMYKAEVCLEPLNVAKLNPGNGGLLYELCKLVEEYSKDKIIKTKYRLLAEQLVTQ